MKIHEYQAKNIIKNYGVLVPEGRVVFSLDELKKAVEELGSETVVVKAQIHAGGRGKAGGVKVVKGAEEAYKAASEILFSKLVTHQTGPEGKEVKRLLIEQGVDIKKELYLGMVVDRSRNAVVIMASEEGGVEIEEVASKSPEKILKEYVDNCVGLRPFQATKIGYKLGFDKGLVREFSKFVSGLYQAFIEKDCSLAEINPLIVTGDNKIMALDAKINFDDNALFRHKDILELRDFDEEEPMEIEASKYNLSYIKLDGNVGCMVNGAGLAMATMDIIKYAGAEPANFLDVGGGANVEAVANAFRIILNDKNVKSVLVNIFGGIVRCDRIANGILEASKIVDINVPVVIRLQGTNAEEARKIIEESGLSFYTAEGLKEAAEKAVELAG
jgi:succinyl-CoA synthetase beta subunit